MPRTNSGFGSACTSASRDKMLSETSASPSPNFRHSARSKPVAKLGSDIFGPSSNGDAKFAMEVKQTDQVLEGMVHYPDLSRDMASLSLQKDNERQSEPQETDKTSGQPSPLPRTPSKRTLPGSQIEREYLGPPSPWSVTSSRPDSVFDRDEPISDTWVSPMSEPDRFELLPVPKSGLNFRHHRHKFNQAFVPDSESDGSWRTAEEYGDTPEAERARASTGFDETPSSLLISSPTNPTATSKKAYRTTPAQVRPDTPNVHTFIPYKVKEDPFKKSLLLLAKFLAEITAKHGYIYGYRHVGHPEYIKIGSAVEKNKELVQLLNNAYPGPVQKRFKSWERGCGWKIEPMFVYEMPWGARHMESLIKAELTPYRRKVEKCHLELDCLTAHNEWFEISVEEARQVVERWQRFNRLMPYCTTRVLNGDIRSDVNRALDSKKPGDIGSWIEEQLAIWPTRHEEKLKMVQRSAKKELKDQKEREMSTLLRSSTFHV